MNSKYRSGYTLFEAGFKFSLGAIAAAGVVSVIATAIGGWITPYDDCDNGKERCGLRVHTDAKTGLQYLSTPGGGIVPRMTIDGSHMQEVEP